MNGRIIFRVLLALVLVAVVAGLGVTAYNAGVARGLAENVTVVQPGEGGAAPAVPAVPYGYGYGYGYGGPFFWHGPFVGFGPLGCLFPLLMLLLFFGLFRLIFWRPWGMGWGRGWRHYGPGEKGTPPMFDEWHRRAHGEPDKPQET
jgi:hypothetical protein